MTRIAVKNVHYKVMCYDVFDMHVHNIDATLGSMVNAMEKASTITQREREIIFTLTSCNFCIPTPGLKPDVTIFVIYE